MCVGVKDIMCPDTRGKVEARIGILKVSLCPAAQVPCEKWVFSGTNLYVIGHSPSSDLSEANGKL